MDDETALRIARLEARIEELESTQAAHVGLDYGGAGANYAHPNQSVDTAEYGGGNYRLDRSGIDILTNGSSSIGLQFVGTVWAWPTPATTQARVSGYTVDEGANQRADVFVTALKAGGPASDLHCAINSTNEVSANLLATDGTRIADVYAYALGSSTEYYVRIRGPLLLSGVTSDFAVLRDGELWYRSDTDKFRAQVNGVTENMAIESWVTANTISHPQVMSRVALRA